MCHLQVPNWIAVTKLPKYNFDEIIFGRDCLPVVPRTQKGNGCAVKPAVNQSWSPKRRGKIFSANFPRSSTLPLAHAAPRRANAKRSRVSEPVDRTARRRDKARAKLDFPAFRYPPLSRCNRASGKVTRRHSRLSSTAFGPDALAPTHAASDTAAPW